MKKIPGNPNSASKISNPESWVDQHGDALFRYAILQLRDPRVAEEVVQETFVSALQAKDRFEGRSTERSWLIGILKHKIIDHIRKSYRERPVENLDVLQDEVENLFDDAGHWKKDQMPGQWGVNAKSLLEQKEFWEILRGCLSNLPQRAADAFSLREIEEMKSDQVCKVLNITPTNLWVLLHRARIQLRRCLELKWFNQKERRVPK